MSAENSYIQALWKYHHGGEEKNTPTSTVSLAVQQVEGKLLWQRSGVISDKVMSS